MSCPSSLAENAAGDDLPLDLARALADRQQTRVAPVAVDRVLARVAVAAVDLHRVPAVPVRHLGGEELRHAGLEIGALAAVEFLRREVPELARRPRARPPRGWR